MSMPPAKPPEILDKVVDIVLAHKHKSTKDKAKGGKKRKKPSTRKKLS
jgi:hypothetical protein